MWNSESCGYSEYPCEYSEYPFEYRTGYPTALTIGAYGSFVVRSHTRTHAQEHAQSITHAHPCTGVDDERGTVVHALVEAGTTQPGILPAGRARALRRLRDVVCETAAAAATKIGEGVAIATNRPMVAHSM